MIGYKPKRAREIGPADGEDSTSQCIDASIKCRYLLRCPRHRPSAYSIHFAKHRKDRP
jgi:hypothetical protein